MRRRSLRTMLGIGLVAVAVSALTVSIARAEEPRLNARSLLFELGAPRVTDRAVAYDEALRDSGPSPLTNGVLQPDGSVRYGRTTVTVTVRNPCPPTDPGMMPEAPPLPGRRAR